LRITILGSGTATPDLHRNASGLIIQAGTTTLAVDMGPGILRRMCEASIDPKSIDIIILTHFHADHVSDVAPFLFASNYAYGPMRTDPFRLVGPRGLEQFFAALVLAYGHWIVPSNDRLIRHELDADGEAEISGGDVVIRSIPATHTHPSLSYRLEHEGMSVTVSGDTDVSENLVKLAKDTDVFICECSLPGRLKTPGHLVPAEAGAMARRANAKKLVLTHFYPPCDETDVVQEAAAEFTGEIVRAHDHLVLEV
jgi:ribonuclease BN (tRNA processing enzyme)